MAADPEFSGVVSDIGGPTANMYQMRCTRPEVEAKCKRLSCVHPTICKLLGTDHGPLIELMRQSRARCRASTRCSWPRGIRMDLAQQSPEYMRRAGEAPRRRAAEGGPRAHRPPACCELMKKPDVDDLRGVSPEAFKKASDEGGQASSSWCPISSPAHPGCDLHAMIDLAVFLKRNGYRPDQVQDFIPAPFDIATCMYYTGHRPVHGQGGLRRPRPAGPQDAAGA